MMNLRRGRGKIAVGDVDGDALLALGAQAVGEQRKIDRAAGAIDLALLHGGELIFEDGLAVVEQAADQRGFAVVDAAGGGEAQQSQWRASAIRRRLGIDAASVGRRRWRVGRLWRGGRHQKYPSRFLISIEPSSSWSMTRFSRSERRNEIISSMIFGTVSASERMRAGAGHAAERAHAALHHLRLFAGQQPRRRPASSRIGFAAHHGFALFREIERHDGNFFGVNVEPDVQLRPIRERKHADAFALVMAAVVKVPQLGALVFRIPLAERIAEGIDAFLGAGFFLVAARAAERRVEAAFGQARRAASASSASRSTSACPARRDSRRRRALSDSCGRSAPRRRAWRTSRETRSSREICSWCRCAAAETEFCRDRRPSAPGAASPTNLCRSNTASPDARIRPPLRAGCRCSRLRAFSDGRVGSSCGSAGFVRLFVYGIIVQLEFSLRHKKIPPPGFAPRAG